MANTELDKALAELDAIPDSLYDEKAKALSEIDSLYDLKKDIPNQENVDDFVPGVKAGGYSTANLINNAGNSMLASALHKVTGNDKWKVLSDTYTQKYSDANKVISEMFPRNVESLKDVKGVGDFVDFVQRGVGEQAANLGLSLITGGMGALVGKSAVGAGVGAAVGSGMVNIPESYAGLRMEGVDDPTSAFIAGSIKAALDTYTPFTALKKVFGLAGEEISDAVTGKILNKVLGAAVKGGATEGATEMMQTVVDQAAEAFLTDHKHLLTEENAWELMEAGLLGALTGGPVQGGATYLQEKRRPPKEVEEDDIGEEDAAAFTDAGSATAYLAERAIDPTIFSTEESLIKAANRLARSEGVKLGQDEETLSPALDSIRMPDRPFGQKQLPSPKAFMQESEELTDEEQTLRKFWESRAKEMQNAAILQTKEAKNLVAKGLLPADVVQLDPARMKTLSERINKSYDALDSSEIDVFIGTEAQDANETPLVMTEKEIQERKKRQSYHLQNLRQEEQSARIGNRTSEIPVKTDTLNRITLKPDDTIFMEGDGQIAFVGGQNEFWSELDKVETQKELRVEDQEKAVKETATGTLSATPQVVGKLKLPPKKNHLVPESAQASAVKPQASFVTPLTPDTTTVSGLNTSTEPAPPLIKASTSLPWEDSRRVKQRAKRIKRVDDTTRFQTFAPNRAENKVFKQNILPNLVANNMRATPMSFEFAQKAKEVIDNLARIVKEVAGHNVGLNLFEQLQSVDPVTNEPISVLRGAQLRNQIYVALDIVNNPNPSETALHEVWHYLFNDSGTFTTQEKKLVDIEYPKVVKWLEKEFGLNPTDFGVMSETAEGKDEVMATAFGLFATKFKNKQPQGFTNPVQNLFRKAFNILNKFGNYLRGAGFKTYEDLFDSILAGSKATTQHQNILNEMATARHQTLSEAVQDRLMEKNRKKGKEAAESLSKVILDVNMENRPEGRSIELGLFQNWRNSWTRSVQGAANRNPVWAIINNLFREQQDMTHEYLNRYQEILRPFQASLDTKERESVMEVMDKVRQVDGKATYIKSADGKTTIGLKYRAINPQTKLETGYTLNNPKLAQAYEQVQQAFAQALIDIEGMVRKDLDMFGITRDVALSDLNSQILSVKQDITAHETARTALKKQKKSDARDAAIKDATKNIRYKKKVIDGITELRDNLASLEKLRKKDYAPHMRFGSYGISVWNKEDLGVDGAPIEGRKAAYFGTMEEGRFKGVDKFQYDLHIKDLKERGLLNNPKFKVYGVDKPFHLTKNKAANKIDSKMVTLELLSTLVQGSDIAALTAMKNEVDSRTRQKGFARILNHDNNIPGYSKDWNRAVPYYFSGMAHFLAKNEVHKRLAEFKVRINTELEEVGMLKAINKYIEYMESPLEDMLKFRQLNFLWTMGFNLSSAALQFFTLPTTTLANMTLWNPNVFQNAAYISKWTKEAVRLGASSSIVDGRPVGGWQDSKALMEEAGKGRLAKRLPGMSVDQWKAKNIQYAKDIIKAVAVGRIKGFAVEDYAGAGSRDIRTSEGRTSDAMSKFTNIAGGFMSIAESMTRFTTFMSHYDMLMSQPEVLARAEKLLAANPLWKEIRKTSQNSVAYDAAQFGVDKAHAVFGKVGRHRLQRGVGGLVIPFMTYPQQILEYMGELAGQGADGRRALATLLSVLFMFTGIFGLPGSEPLKELYEAAHLQVKGQEIDIDRIIREKVAGMTDSPNFALFMTQGLGRPLLGADIGKRVGMGLAVPGSDIAVAMLQGRSSGLDILGVQGSMMTNAIRGINEYMSGGDAMDIIPTMTPTALSNVIQAMNWRLKGAKTAKGDMLMSEPEVTFPIAAKKLLGFTPAEIAERREEKYWVTMSEKEWSVFLKRQRSILTRLATDRILATRAGDEATAKKILQKQHAAVNSLREWAKETGYPLNFADMNSTIRQKVKENLTGRKDPKNARKSVRPKLKDIKNLTRTTEDEE